MNKIWRVDLEFGIGPAYSNDVIRGVAEYRRRFGPFQFVTSRGGDFELATLRHRKDIDGIIVYRSQEADFVDSVDWPRHVPIVSVEPARSPISRWQVLPDHRAVGRLVAQEFLQRAFRHFAYYPYIGPRPYRGPQHWDRERLEGFIAALRSVDTEPTVYVPPRSEGIENESQPTGPLVRWLVSLPKPIGIMAAKDESARRLLLSADAAGIHVPEEVAVIGVDNEPWVEIASPSISSVELDGFRAGYVAMELLHQRMEGQRTKAGLVRIAPRRLITRRSSDITAIADADVAAAMRFIAEHATLGINVGRVVDTVALSRRSAIPRGAGPVYHGGNPLGPDPAGQTASGRPGHPLAQGRQGEWFPFRQGPEHDLPPPRGHDSVDVSQCGAQALITHLTSPRLKTAITPCHLFHRDPFIPDRFYLKLFHIGNSTQK